MRYRRTDRASEPYGGQSVAWMKRSGIWDGSAAAPAVVPARPAQRRLRVPDVIGCL